MTDRRLLRRYLALVRHAQDLLEASYGGPASPAPAEAVTVIEELVAALEPARLGRTAEQTPRPSEIRLELAGWIH